MQDSTKEVRTLEELRVVFKSVVGFNLTSLQKVNEEFEDEADKFQDIFFGITLEHNPLDKDFKKYRPFKRKFGRFWQKARAEHGDKLFFKKAFNTMISYAENIIEHEPEKEELVLWLMHNRGIVGQSLHG